MSITIKLWDLWVRFEKYVNLHLGKRVRRELVKRNEAYADAFLKEYRKQEHFFSVAPAKCSHLKGNGGHGRPFNPVRDYNIAQHTFADGRTKVWCLYNCGLVAWNGDKDFENIKNLMDSSSNRESASERIILRTQYSDGRPDKYVVTFLDKAS